MRRWLCIGVFEDMGVALREKKDLIYTIDYVHATLSPTSYFSHPFRPAIPNFRRMSSTMTSGGSPARCSSSGKRRYVS